MVNEKLNHESISKISLGLAAGSFVGILSLLQVPKLDTYLIIFLICFTILLPTNLIIGMMFYSGNTEIIDKRFVKYGKFVLLSIITFLFIAFVGILCLILHLYP